MRDQFGEVDPDEIDVIDFIESDPHTFSAGSDTDAETVEQPSQLTTPTRRRWILAAAASVVAIATAAVLVWSPWSGDDRSAFPDSAAPQLTLTDELVFDDPPAELTGASLGLNTNDEFSFRSLEGGEGYFFAEPGASWNLNGDDPKGAFAGFVALPEDHEEAEDLSTVDDGETLGTVQGARAVFSPVVGGLREINFGPVDGLVFSVVSSNLSLAETQAFAEAIGVDDGVPTVSDAALGEMLPVGDIGDYLVAIGAIFGALSPFGATPGLVAVHYGTVADFGDLGGFDAFGMGYSIATQPVAGTNTLAMVQFIGGGEGGRSVHGQHAIVTEGAFDPFADGAPDESALVAWVEGGRLIVVVGPENVDAIVALAETVRPATDDEWAAVVDISRVPFFPQEDIDFGDNDLTELYRLIDGATLVAYSAAITDGELSTCIDETTDGNSTASCSSTFVELPLLTSESVDGRTFVLAVIEGDAAAELRITLADGTIETLALEDFGDDLPGLAVATLLPDDHGAVELWVEGELVAIL